MTQGFVYSDGTMKSLGALGGSTSIAYGINKAGHIVGYSNTMNDVTRLAFLYKNGTMASLGTILGGHPARLMASMMPDR